VGLPLPPPPVEVAAGSDDVALTLSLARPARLQGRVTGKDKRGLGGVVVAAILQGTDHTRFGALTDPSGFYLFERLAAGSYDVSAVNRTESGLVQRSRTLSIESGKTAEQDIEITSGAMSLIVSPYVGVPEGSQLALLEGTSAPRTLGDLEQLARTDSEHAFRYEPIVNGRDARFRELDEGAYTLCRFTPPKNIHVAGNNQRTWQATRSMQSTCMHVSLSHPDEVVNGP
jgi:hypothetical protein